MTNRNYMPAMALREHMLEGHRISLIEAMLLFGVQNLNAEMARMKRDGFLILSERAPMADILRRLNEVTLCKVPPELPYREIHMREYWITP